MDEKIASFLLSILDGSFMPVQHNNRIIKRAEVLGYVRQRKWWYPIYRHKNDLPWSRPFQMTQSGLDWIESYTDPKTEVPKAQGTDSL